MSRVVHFELHANDPERAMKFYSEALGWKFHKWDGGDYWLIDTGDASSPGINGGLMLSRDGNPRTVNTLRVDSVDEYAQRVVDAGGQVVVPKMAIAGVGYVAYCTDPAGNLFGIMHDDSAAA